MFVVHIGLADLNPMCRTSSNVVRRRLLTIRLPFAQAFRPISLIPKELIACSLFSTRQGMPPSFTTSSLAVSSSKASSPP